jgi:hypothetical protein
VASESNVAELALFTISVETMGSSS